MIKKNFVESIHQFRALAVLLVVIGHTMSMFVWHSPFEIRLLDILFDNGSIWFVFLAGYLLQHQSGDLTYTRYLKKKFYTVLIPYLCVSIPAVLIFIMFKKQERMWDGFYDLTMIQQILGFFLTGFHLAPYWFIPMIAIIYLLAPFLLWAERNRILYYLIPLWALGAFFTYKGYPWQSLTHYFLCYVLGMLCCRFKVNIQLFFKDWWSFLFVSSLVIGLAFIEYHASYSIANSVNYVQKLILAITLIGALSKFDRRKVKIPFLDTIANQSFAIFLLHSYFVSAMKILFIRTLGYYPSGSILLLVVATFIVVSFCMITVIIARYAFGERSQMIIGS